MLSRLYSTTCLKGLYYTPSSKTTLFHRSSQLRPFSSSRLHLAEELQKEGAKNATEISLGGGLKEQTAQLYLDNVFPLKMNSLDIRQMLLRNNKHFLESKTEQAIPKEGLPFNFTVKDIAPRTKDGGAIVTFTFKSSDTNKSQVAKEIVSRISEHIEKAHIVAPFNFQPVRSFLVKGEPFLEDMVNRFPTLRLRIEFQNEPVPVEKLYKHLRPYGRVTDIALYPNPIMSKDPARYAIVQFTRVRFATTARNCLHGHVINGTRLNILYERQLRTNVVKDWLVSHPRITVPLFAAIFAGITYVVFDPIRVFFITSKVTQRFNPEEYALYRWLRNETWGHFIKPKSKDYLKRKSVWAEDTEKIDTLKSWLAETPETFVVITGHKGSGKSALIKAAIEDRTNKVIIDCEKLGNTRNMAETTKNLAKELGYFPIFTWLASMSGLLDTIVGATTGQKTGLSSRPESQIKEVLETSAIALRDIAPDEAKRRLRQEEKENQVPWIDKFKNYVMGSSELMKDIEKKVEKEVKKVEKKSDENIPIVVIDNFMYRETAKSQVVWEELANWASLLIENEIAHVVFISSNGGAAKTLAKALPGKSFSSIALSDAPPEMSLSYVQKQLKSEVQDPYLPEVVSALGGRLSELEMLVAKMKMNMDAKTAFDEIVVRNIIELRKYGLGDYSSDENKNGWTAVEFWTIVKEFTQKSVLNYDELKWGKMFNGSDESLKAMERAELITIVQKEGRADSIRPGKPVFYTVFKHLISDQVFYASMEVQSNIFLKKQAEAEMLKLENTIDKLTNINKSGKPPREIDTRIRFLLTKVVSVEKTIEEYDANIKAAKEAISKGWIPEQ